MTFYEIYHGLISGVENMSWVEGLAVGFAIVSVLCARANHTGVYPAGIAGILLSIYIFIGEEYKLYPDAALNLYYLVMSIYGWYFWAKKPKQSSFGTNESPPKETPITWCTRKEIITAAIIFVVLWGGLFWWLDTYKINNVPLMDSFSSAMAATGMWLLAKRKIENWLALLVADAVGIALFFVKKLILFSALNIFYVIIAILGFIAWKKIYDKRTAKLAG